VTTVIPIVHPQISISVYAVIGRIISHGYLATGILPDRIALPVLLVAILGPSIKIPDYILIDSFMDYLSAIERITLKNAFNSCANESSFQPSV